MAADFYFRSIVTVNFHIAVIVNNKKLMRVKFIIQKMLFLFVSIVSFAT